MKPKTYDEMCAVVESAIARIDDLVAQNNALHKANAALIVDLSEARHVIRSAQAAILELQTAIVDISRPLALSSEMRH